MHAPVTTTSRVPIEYCSLDRGAAIFDPPSVCMEPFHPTTRETRGEDQSQSSGRSRCWPSPIPIPIQPPVWNNGDGGVARFVHAGDGKSSRWASEGDATRA